MYQHCGDIIFIPAGYAHAVNNQVGNSIKYAMDFVPLGGTFQCVISHLFVSRLVQDKLTQDYMHILDTVLPTLKQTFNVNIKKALMFGE